MGVIEPRSVRLRDGSSVLIRAVEPGDAGPMLSFLLHGDATTPDGHRATLLHERRTTAERRLVRMAESREKPGEVEIVAVVDPVLAPDTSGLVGEISFQCREFERMRHHGHFGISVHARYRDRGLGRLLVSELLVWATAHAFVEKVCLGVFANNPRAIHLYRSMGFVEEGRRSGEFRIVHERTGEVTYVDDIQMSRWVKPKPPQTEPPTQGRA